MVAQVTAHFSFIKPDLSGSPTTWGQSWNANADSLDSLIYANQQAISLGGVPIGVALDFFGVIIPTNYLPCDGSTYNVSDYPILGPMLAIGAAPTFNTPSIGGKVVIGANATYALGTSGGATTVTLDATMIPAHTHTITQVAHTHTASQTAHTHSDAGHIHGASDAGHQHGYQNTGAGHPGLASGGSFAGNFSDTTVVGYASITVGTGYASLNSVAPAIAVAAATPAGPTATGSIGGGQPHSNMQPWIAATKIIRAK